MHTSGMSPRENNYAALPVKRACGWCNEEGSKMLGCVVAEVSEEEPQGIAAAEVEAVAEFYGSSQRNTQSLMAD